MPSLPIADERLERNVAVTLGDVFTLLHMASHYKTRAKTVYYKCAFILLASIIEALVYHFIECHCNVDETLVSKEDSTKLVGRLNIHHTHTGSSKILWLAEEVKVEAGWDDITRDFNNMNNFCKKHLSINHQLYRDLDYVRTKRNEIHLQGLQTTSRSWTKLQINKAGNTMVKMLNELETFNPS